MIEIGDKVRLKFAVAILVDGDYTNVANPNDIVIVECFITKCDKKTLMVRSKSNVLFEVKYYEVEKLFAIPDYINELPNKPGWYLYKLAVDDVPTYCELRNIGNKLYLTAGDNGSPVETMNNFWWLKVR